jgi:hypothetical protein
MVSTKFFVSGSSGSVVVTMSLNPKEVNSQPLYSYYTSYLTKDTSF